MQKLRGRPLSLTKCIIDVYNLVRGRDFVFIENQTMQEIEKTEKVVNTKQCEIRVQ